MIKKENIVNQQRQFREQEIKDLERDIDTALETALVNTIELPIRIKVYGRSKPAIDAIKEKYEKEGGYTVRMDYGDQRDPYCDLVLS